MTEYSMSESKDGQYKILTIKMYYPNNNKSTYSSLSVTGNKDQKPSTTKAEVQSLRNIGEQAKINSKKLTPTQSTSNIPTPPPMPKKPLWKKDKAALGSTNIGKQSTIKSKKQLSTPSKKTIIKSDTGKGKMGLGMWYSDETERDEEQAKVKINDTNKNVQKRWGHAYDD